MKIIHFFAYILAITIISCQSKPSDNGSTLEGDAQALKLTKAQIKTLQIKTTTIKTVDWTQTIRVNGKTELPPQNLISIAVPLGGYVKSIHVLPGQKVGRGQALAYIEDPQFIQIQQEYLTAKAEVERSKYEYQRQKELYGSQASSQKAMQAAKAEYESQTVLMNASAQKLKMMGVEPSSRIQSGHSLVASISGVVSKVNINKGGYVTPSEVAIELMDVSDMHIILKAYEKDLAQLFIGQALTLSSSMNSTQSYKAKIILISPSIDADGSVEVHAHLQMPNQGLLPGMMIVADVQTPIQRIKAVPAESLVMYEGKDYVFVQTAPQTFKMVPVQTGLENGQWVELLQFKLPEKSVVVSQGAYGLLMALKNGAED